MSFMQVDGGVAVSEILPPDQADFLLQQLGGRAAGGAATQDLAQTGTEMMNQLGSTLQEYGQSVVRPKKLVGSGRKSRRAVTVATPWSLRLK